MCIMIWVFAILSVVESMAFVWYVFGVIGIVSMYWIAFFLCFIDIKI